jgi:hypothetical protein
VCEFSRERHITKAALACQYKYGLSHFILSVLGDDQECLLETPPTAGIWATTDGPVPVAAAASLVPSLDSPVDPDFFCLAWLWLPFDCAAFLISFPLGKFVTDGRGLG